MTFSLALALVLVAAGAAGCGGASVETSPSGAGGAGAGGNETTSGSGGCNGTGGGPADCEPASTMTATTELPSLDGWWRHVGGPDQEAIQDLAMAADGDVVAVGAFRGTTDFGAGATTAVILEDAFIARYAPDGSLRWLRHLGSAVDAFDNVEATGVAIDGAGNALVTGKFEGTVDPGTGPLVSDGPDDLFVVRYDAEGEALWARRIGGDGFDRVSKIATDAEGNALLAGTQSGQLFVAKLSAATGEDLWFHSLGMVQNGLSEWPPVYDVATDPAGDFYIAGSFYGSANLGGETLTAGGSDIFLARYRGSDGAHLWSEKQGGKSSPIDGGDQTYSLAVNAGSVVLCGSILGPVDLGGALLAADDSERVAFLARYDAASGAHLWSRRLDSLWAQQVELAGGTAMVLGLLPPDDLATTSLGAFALEDGADAGEVTVPASGRMAIGDSGRVVLAIDFSGSMMSAGGETFNQAGKGDFLIGPFEAAGGQP